MATERKVDDDAWERGELGRSKEHAQRVVEDDDRIDAALELQLISVRLQKRLIEGLKLIAQRNGIGYQPLIRQVLSRFVDCEIKQYIREDMASRQDIHPKALKVAAKPRQRKAA